MQAGLQVHHSSFPHHPHSSSWFGRDTNHEKGIQIKVYSDGRRQREDPDLAGRAGCRSFGGRVWIWGWRIEIEMWCECVMSSLRLRRWWWWWWWVGDCGGDGWLCERGRQADEGGNKKDWGMRNRWIRNSTASSCARGCLPVNARCHARRYEGWGWLAWGWDAFCIARTCNQFARKPGTLPIFMVP